MRQMISRRHLTVLTLVAELVGCNSWKEIDQAVTAATRRGIEEYQGTLSTANLIPARDVSEPVSGATVGRTFVLDGPSRVSLIAANDCDGILPQQRDVDVRNPEVSAFKYSFLQMIEREQAPKLDFRYLAYGAELKAQFTRKTIVGAEVAVSRVLGMNASAETLQTYEACCILAGTCGDYLVTSVYEMRRASSLEANRPSSGSLADEKKASGEGPQARQ